MAVDIAQVSTDYQYGFHDEENYIFKSGRGLTRSAVRSTGSSAKAVSTPASAQNPSRLSSARVPVSGVCKSDRP